MNRSPFSMKPLLRLGVEACALLLLTGCQQVDPRSECARLEADSMAVVNRNTKPPFGLDLIEERRFYLEERWNIDFQLLAVANPYVKSLKTRDPYTFCESLTGRRALPSEVPNPYR